MFYRLESRDNFVDVCSFHLLIVTMEAWALELHCVPSQLHKLLDQSKLEIYFSGAEVFVHILSVLVWQDAPLDGIIQLSSNLSVFNCSFLRWDNWFWHNLSLSSCSVPCLDASNLWTWYSVPATGSHHIVTSSPSVCVYLMELYSQGFRY